MTKKNKKKAATKKKSPDVYFETVLDVLLNAVRGKVGALKLRSGGAQKYGIDGMFICAEEALSAAQGEKDYNHYITSAAYEMAAAMFLINQWGLPIVPRTEKKEVTNA